MAEPRKNQETIDALKTLGVGTIISLNAFEWSDLQESQLEHISYDLPDPLTVPHPSTELEGHTLFTEQVSAVLNAMITATSNAFDQVSDSTVVIHCKVGASRTGNLLAAWLHVHSAETADLIKQTSYGTISSPIRNLGKSTNPGLFIMLNNNTDLLNDLLALRHPKSIVSTQALFEKSAPTKSC